VPSTPELFGRHEGGGPTSALRLPEGRLGVEHRTRVETADGDDRVLQRVGDAGRPRRHLGFGAVGGAHLEQVHVEETLDGADTPGREQDRALVDALRHVDPGCLETRHHVVDARTRQPESLTDLSRSQPGRVCRSPLRGDEVFEVEFTGDTQHDRERHRCSRPRGTEAVEAVVGRHRGLHGRGHRDEQRRDDDHDESGDACASSHVRPSM
jgi:hypothetical protein